jgi:hypothetical protein
MSKVPPQRIPALFDFPQFFGGDHGSYFLYKIKKYVTIHFEGRSSWWRFYLV